MFEAAERIQVLLICVSVFSIWHFGIRKLLLDWYRQSLFEIRDGLFEEASKGTISFDAEEYRLIVGVVNTYIRYAHHMTLLKITTLGLLFRHTLKDGKRMSEEIRAELLSVKNNRERNVYKKAYDKIQLATGLYFFVSNPVLLIVIIAVIGFTIFNAVLTLSSIKLFKSVESWVLGKNNQKVLAMPLTAMDDESSHRFAHYAH